MQAFRFRLAKVLEWYTTQYELEERRLNACLAALEDARQAIVALQAEHQAVEREMVVRSSIEAREFVALGLYRLGVKKRQVELEIARDRCQAEVQAQRARLEAAQRRLRLVEKLRERRVAEHVYAESRELDELAADAYFAKWAAR